MFNLPYIPSADELIDKAFRRGSKHAKAKRSTRKGQRDVRLKKSELERVKAVSCVIKYDLKAVIKNFPSYDQLPVFYQRLLDIKVDKDRYKHALGAVQWCIKQIERIETKTLADIRITKDTSYVKGFLGRSSSIVHQISDELDDLVDIKMRLREFPTLEEQPTLVIAGYPNVGKSTFMRNLTGSDVKIAIYPFTTKEILIGHCMIRYQRYQIIDSPGLLDRPMGERNKIELQAILAVSELADVILFILDPTQDIGPQMNLLEEIRKNFNVPINVAINKKDIVKSPVLEELIKELNVSSNFIISAMDVGDCRRVFELVFSGKDD